MIVVIAHEGLCAAQHVRELFLVSKTIREVALLVHHDHIRVTLCELVKLGAQVKNPFVGAVNFTLLGLVEIFLFHQFACRAHAIFEICHPHQVLEIAQAAASVFDVRLLHIDGVSVFRVARCLILDACFQISVRVPAHALFLKALLEPRKQLLVAIKQARFEHRGARLHFLVCLRHRLVEAARGAAWRVVARVDDVLRLLHDLLHARRKLRATCVEKGQVDVAFGIQLSSSVATKRDQSETRHFFTRCRERIELLLHEMTKPVINHLCAESSALQPALCLLRFSQSGFLGA